MKEYTPEELGNYDGKGTQPTYTAYKGKVYDVSGSPFWDDGVHFEHPSGKDLTEGMSGAPHGDEVFENFPQIGVLIPSVPGPQKDPESRPEL